MRQRAAGRGFTLVEVVIAISLVSLIMLGLVAALRAFGEAGARIETRTLQADDQRLVSAFLRQVLEASSIKHLRILPDGNNVPFFQGDGQTLEWLAPMPARHGVGGLHRLRLSLREDGGVRLLVLQFVPFIPFAADDPVTKDVDWSAVPAQTLAEHVDGFALHYQPLGQPDWVEAWNDPAVLPGRVQLQISAGGLAWPDLIVPVLAAEISQDVNQSAPIGRRG